MKTNFLRIFAALSVTGSLVLLSPAALAIQPIDTPEIRAAAQSAATAHDHEVVAKHYDNVAVQAQDLQSHTEALIRDYEQTVTATVREAAMHRQMASRLQEKHASSDTQRENAVNGL